ncbi:MAG: uracil-DNA glycosylase [Acidobacteria bacterium]|nr:uracil-DNA glycosylase [Acidobacteriota bacterium]
MNTREELAAHLALYAELGVAGISRDRTWRTRADTGGQIESGQPEGAAAETMGPLTPSASPDGLVSVREDLGDCTRCKLHRLGRRQIVFGVGNPKAELMFVGEAPGQDEDVQGIPFVGRAGQLLTKIIEAIQLRRGDVYIANVIKCRPPQNRNPEPDEVASCQPFLFAQIDAIRPKVIVALGTFAARALLETDDPISRLRGRVYDYRGAKLIATFHPAFLLRSPERKRDVWEDMKVVRDLLRREGSA